MPVNPALWNTGDFVTATRLDGDFYLSSGQVFAPNGIRFHARRPLYKSYNGNSGNTLASGAWGDAYANSGNVVPDGSANVIADTPGMLGAWFDPNQKGRFNLSNLTGAGGSMGGGGLGPTNGGLMLVATYCLWNATPNTGVLGCGVGNYQATTSPPASWGTLQPTNSTTTNCCFTVDLVDAAALRYANFAFNGSSASMAPASSGQADGSGEGTKSQAFWASVYSANASVTTPAPAPLINWTGQTITASLLNGSTGLRPIMNFLNAPPLLRATATASQSIPTANVAATATNLAATSGFNAWGAFSSNTFTAPVDGLYLFHGYATINIAATRLRVGAQVNAGATYWGPWTPSVSGSGSISGTKTQIFSLNAGDTVTMQLMASQACSTNATPPARMVVLWLSAQGAKSLPPPPDTTFRWAAGTQGPLDSAFNTHFANDLNFLYQRPYLLSYQTAAQAISMATTTLVTMDTVAGVVHFDAGDPWSGWSSSTHLYTAPVAGWYLAVEEVTLAQPTLTATPSVNACLQVSPSGVDPYGRFQQQNMPTNTDGGGATAVSLYYLRAGDTIGPAIETFNSSSTTINTDTTVQSHFELVWLGEG